MAAIPTIDPVNITYEGGMILIALLVGLVIWYKWEAVVFFFTNDRKLHCDCLDWGRWFHRLCTTICCCCCGDWTKNVTAWLCCCCQEWQGAPIHWIFGDCLGVVSRTIEINSIVAGDLPFSGNGDFYITVECGSNPRQTSAVVHDGYAKVVHFADTIILKVRPSVFEARIKFIVWELNFAISERLCEVHLHPKSVWRYAQEVNAPPKRFAMTVQNTDFPTVAVPWIAMVFRDLDNTMTVDNRLQSLQYSQASYFDSFARVRLPGDEVGADEEGFDQGFCMGCRTMYMSNPQQTMWSTTGRTRMPYQEVPVQQFKNNFRLLDRDGEPAWEPKENQLWRMQCIRSICIFFYCLVTWVSIALVVGWFSYRFYVWSCYRQYRWITVAELSGKPMPMTTPDLLNFWEQCQNSIQGIAVSALPVNDPRRFCRPTDEQIMNTCNTLDDTLHPRAFKELGHQIDKMDQSFRGFSSLFGNGLGCKTGLCKERNDFVLEVDCFALPAVFGLIVLNIVWRCWCIGGTVNWMKHSWSKQNAEKEPPPRE